MTYPSLLFTTADTLSATQAAALEMGELRTHPDVYWLEPLPEKTSITIAQVQALLPPLTLAPSRADHKLAIIVPAHLLTLPAQQALLKTLEEPPPRTQIVLVTSHASMLLPTILSRCEQRTAPTTALPPDNSGEQLFEQLNTFTISQAIDLAATLAKDKTTATDQLQALLLYLHQTNRLLLMQKELILALTQMAGNVNLKMSLEHFFFEWIECQDRAN